MANDSPAPSSAKKPPSGAHNTSADIAQNQKDNAPLIEKMQGFLKSYHPTMDTSKQDVLDDQYSIDLTQPLPEFDTAQAKAYVAADLKQPGKQLVARVCEWGTVQRYRVIEQLKGLEHRGLVTLLAAGNIRLSTTRQERFVIFYDRPQGIKLAELIKRKKMPVNTVFIMEHILSPLANAIQQFADLEISHGGVNTNNIFISTTAVLGPCASEPCGLSQPFHYEPPERIQALPHAKGEGSTAVDFYALAVVLLEILHGDQHLAAFTTPDMLIMALLSQGPYHSLMRDEEVPEVFYDFLRGVLTLTPYDRWTGKQVLAWLGGKRFNVLPPPMPAEGIRPFEFGEILVHTRRELAHVFSKDWERMISELNNTQLAHWITVSLRNKELSELVGRLSRTARGLSVGNEMLTYEALCNILMLLDPSGPIRIKHLSMNIDGIDSLCAEFFSKQALPELQMLARFVELNMVNQWIELKKKVYKEDFVITSFVNAQNIRLDRLRGAARNTGTGFGLERMLYDLNPDMACLSPLLQQHNVTTLASLLIHLDHIAPQLPEGGELIDRHIASFIASKLLITREIYLEELSSIPELADNKTIMAIYLLGASQVKVKNLRLPGLTHFLALRTLPLLDYIHSRTMRKKYKAALFALAPSGSIPKLAELIVSADYATKDQMGFQAAFAQYQQNAAMIRFYEAAENIEAESARMGYRIAKMVAYLCLLGAVYLVTRGGM